MGKNSTGVRSVVFFILLFAVGATLGYVFYLTGRSSNETETKTVEPARKEDSVTVKLYYPVNGRLRMEEHKVAKQFSKRGIAEATLAEFLAGPESPGKSHMPQGTRLLGIYLGMDDVLYADFSVEFRNEFQGDVVSEFLLLRALYESVINNVYGVSGVKILVEGKEIETIGGHISLEMPLGKAVSQFATGGSDAR